jgi:PadR family transcriptional regulator PadR
MRRTNAAISVMAALMEDPSARHWGYSLSKRAGVRSGVLYPVLHRMLDEGWLRDGWEDPREIEGRPPRRYYELTGEGIEHFRTELEVARTDRRFSATLGTVG